MTTKTKEALEELKKIKNFIRDLLPTENCVFEKIVAFPGEHESPEELIKEFVLKYLNNDTPRKKPCIKNDLFDKLIEAVSAYLNQPRRLHFCCFYQALELEDQALSWLQNLKGEVVTSHTIEPS